MLSGGFYHAQTTYFKPSKDRTKSDKTDFTMLSGGFYHAQTTYFKPSKDRTKSDKTDYKLNMHRTKAMDNNQKNIFWLIIV